MTTERLQITTHMTGRAFSRADVLTWEASRATKVARRLGIDASGDPAELMRRVSTHKLAMGHAAIEKLLKRDLRVSGAGSSFGAAVSRGRRKVATAVLTCESGAAEFIPSWYEEKFLANDEAFMLAASPDHWLFRNRPDGKQEVLETAAGSPAVIQMFFDDSDVRAVRTPPDPTYPVEWVAIARGANGTPIGGIRHRFRDNPKGGFQIELNVEFPITTLPFMITWHCWHLAGEFSNWLEFATGVRPPLEGE